MRSIFTLSALAVFLVVVLAQSLSGATITTMRLNTDNIVVPVFDTTLGTLNSANLAVELLGGGTSIEGGHHHGSLTILSTNVRPTSAGFAPLSLISGLGGSHSHTIITPNYTGGGLSIGSFSFNTDTAGPHNHPVFVRFGGPQSGPYSGLKARANLQVFSSGDHGQSYATQTKNLGFSGLGLTPFLSASDIVISAGSLFTSNGSNHNHIIPAFSANGWNFASSTTLSSLSGPHSLDPRFNVTATFDYTPTSASPVPEPTSMALFGLTAIGMGTSLRRKRRQSDAELF